MTIKELVTFTGKTERTIRNWIVKAGNKLDVVPYEEIAQGIPHDYSVLEVENILKSGSMHKSQNVYYSAIEEENIIEVIK